LIDPSKEADATRGSVCDALVEGIDLAPTFIEYFGGTPPDHILEGRSLMPLLRGEKPPWREVVFSEYDYAMQEVRVMLNQPIDRCRLFTKRSHANTRHANACTCLDPTGRRLTLCLGWERRRVVGA